MLALASLAVLLLAQRAPMDAPRDRSAPPDRQFLQDAAEAGRAEVELAELAGHKAGDPRVRDFARHMADDHAATNKELMQLAKRQGVSLSTDMAPEHRALLDRLSRLEAGPFDRRYMDATLDAHREDVALFEEEVAVGRDPEVKAFAERTLPMLRHHLELARGTADETHATAGRK
jgi:putative membrane protein